MATLSILPSIESFNIAKKVALLHPGRKVPGVQAQTPAPIPSADISSLASALILQMMMQSGLLPGHSPTTPYTHEKAAGPAAVASHGPTMTQQTTPERPQPVLSSPIPSPSKLAHFLEYAEMHLHIEDTKEYQATLEQHKLGPDVLPFASEKLLLKIGIPVGDII